MFQAAWARVLAWLKGSVRKVSARKISAPRIPVQGLTMSLLSQYLDAQDVDFQRRVQQAIIFAAEQISAEVNTTPNHANRVVLSKGVLNNPDSFAAKFAQGIVADGTTKTATDGAISLRVSAIWDGFAGVP